MGVCDLGIWDLGIWDLGAGEVGFERCSGRGFRERRRRGGEGTRFPNSHSTNPPRPTKSVFVAEMALVFVFGFVFLLVQAQSFM